MGNVVGNKGLYWVAAALLLPLVALFDLGEPADGSISGFGAGDGAARAFHVALRDEYLSLAATEGTGMSDWTDSQYFSLKALQADRGATPQPELLADWWLPEDAQPILNDARNRLLELLTKGGRMSAPREMARAQAAFDCWMERQEENWNIGAIITCQDRFEAAMRAVRRITSGADSPLPPRAMLGLGEREAQRYPVR